MYKNMSLKLTLKLRIVIDSIYILFVLVMGNITIFYLEGTAINGNVKTILTFFGFLICVIVLLVSFDWTSKDADPINEYNYAKYIFLYLFKIFQLIIIYIIANIVADKYCALIIFNGFELMFVIIFLNIHKSIIVKYEKLSEGFIDKKIKEYSNCYKNDNEIHKFVRNNLKYIAYLVIMSFFYEYIIGHWVLTVLGIIFNTFILKVCLYGGIKQYIDNHKIYFLTIILLASIGFVIVKLAHDNNLLELLPFIHYTNTNDLWFLVVFFQLPTTKYNLKLWRHYKMSEYYWEK